MRKPIRYPIPTLAFAALEHIQRIRSAAQQGLLNCGLPGTKFLNHDQAAEVMCSCAIEDVDVRLKHYMGLPEFRQEWVIEIAERSIDSILGCFPNDTYEIRYEGLSRLPGLTLQPTHEDSRQFFEEIQGAVFAHVRERLGIAKDGDKASRKVDLPKSRKELRDSYLSTFPDVKILDICWAAQQTYREWKRWIKGEAKDGLKPDRAFRHVLTSGKPPEEIRKKPRPTKYS